MANHDLGSKSPRDLWPEEARWTIDWVVPSNDSKPNPNEVFPDAHTHGLRELGHKELQIRRLSLEASSFILNLVAAWVASGGEIADGDTFSFKTTTGSFAMKVKEEEYTGHAEKEIILRLSWDKDPA